VPDEPRCIEAVRLDRAKKPRGPRGKNSRLSNSLLEHYDVNQSAWPKADHYPSFLVAAAEAKCREETAKHVSPVGKVAIKEQWFKHQ
jgi:hypothetical protein